jgi:TonB family protein
MRWSVVFLLGVLFLPSQLLAQGATNPARGAKKENKVTKPPELLNRVEAEYSEEARQKRIQGIVKLRITIDKNGNVSKVEVLEGLGHGLDKAAKDAARQFEFSPAEINGEPASVRLPFRIRFALPPKPAKLEGKVVEQTTGAGIQGAQISLEYIGEEYDDPIESGLETEQTGAFEFSEVPPGKYRLNVKIPKYQPKTVDITLKAGQQRSLVFELSKSPVVLKGQVLRAGDRVELAGIRVTVKRRDSEETLASGRTDEKGRFSFRDLPNGPKQVVVDAQGFETYTTTETIQPDRVVSSTYYLKAKYQNEFAVTTTARKETRSLERDQISLDEVRKIPGTGGDVVRVVQNLPGVARPSFLSGQIVVRGASPEDTKTFLNGDEIPFVYHFFGGPAVINSEMIEEVNFYPGNFSARYGRALGGIIDLQTRDPRTDGYHGFTEFDLLDGTFQLEGPITENLSFAISGRRSYVGETLPLFVPEDTFQTTVAPNYYDFQGWLNWDVNSTNDVELFLYGSRDRVELLFDDDNPQGGTDVQITGLNFGNSFYRGQLRWDWTPDGPVSNEFMVSAGVNNVRFRGASDLFFDLQFRQLQLRDDFTVDVADNLEWTTGADVQIGETAFEFDIPGSDSDGAGPNFTPRGLISQRETPLVRPAFYTEASWTLFDKLELIPGLRLDYFGDVDEWSLSPRGNVKYSVTDEVTAKGGVGLFTQPPNPGATQENFGNPNLSYQQAMHYSGGAVWKPLRYIEFDATVFYRDLYDQVRQTDDRTRDPETGEVENKIYDNRGEGRSYGLELLARHYPANKFFGWVAYTLSRAERFDFEENEYRPYEFDQTHNLTALGGYNLPWNMDISFRFQLVTGNPYTPVVDSVYDADEGEYRPIDGENNSERNDTFHQLDVRLDKKWVFNTWVLGAYIDVINVYNHANQEGVRYNYDYTKKAPLNGLPILPTLGVNGRF